MKKLLLAATSIVLFSTPAFANSDSSNDQDILVCTFSQPWIQLYIDLNSGVVEYVHENHNIEDRGILTRTTYAQGAQLVGASLDHFQLGSLFHGVTQEGVEFLTLTLNFNGYDGIAEDLLYPFEAKFSTPWGAVLTGGCYIPSRPKYDVSIVNAD